MQPAKMRSRPRKTLHSGERQQLMEQNLPAVKRIVFRIAAHLPSSIERDELVNAGVIGLSQAIERFDPSRKDQFSAYAAYRIRGAVLNELRSRDHLSRTYRKKLRDMEQTSLRLEKILGRQATDREIAEEMGLELDRFHQIRRMAAFSFVSLEEVGFGACTDRKALAIQRMQGDVPDPSRLVRLKEIRKILARAIDDLPEKEKMVISLYYTDELTMKEVGAVLGITESRVSQIHSQAVLRLRKKLRKSGMLEAD